MAEIENRPADWLCIEAHCKAHFFELDRFFYDAWFPTKESRGVFVPEGRLQKRIGGNSHLAMDQALERTLKVKDRFSYTFPAGESNVQVRVKVMGRLPTAIMHRPIDLAAFPSGRYLY